MAANVDIAASHVLWPDGTLAPGIVAVADGLVVDVSAPNGPVPDRILAPGFVDLQVNGIGAVDVAEATGDDWDRLDERLVVQGTTTWCPTLITAEWASTVEAAERVAAASRRSGVVPSIAGAHLEGPWLGSLTGAHPVEHVRPATDAAVDQLPEGVALVTLGPDAPGALEACRALVERGVVVSLGHSGASLDQSRSLVDAGASMITHLGNATGPVTAREPGLFGLGLDDDRVSVAVIADLVHLHPAVLRLIAGVAERRLVLTTDAIAWESSGHRRRGVDLVDGAPRLPDGTLAGSVLTMDAAVRNVVEAGALDLPSALRAASARPAEVLGLDDRGELRPGARADLVALDDSLRVVDVWIGGVHVGLVPS